MDNNTYFGGGGNMRDLFNGQGIGVDINGQNTIESASQYRNNQQLLSPTTTHRHDSMFSCSSIGGTPRHSISHQAEAQPCANIHQTVHSPIGYTQVPVNGGMSRSASQYSSASSGQRSFSRSLQRASRGSFGSILVPTGSAMSRTISSTSASQRTAPQPYPFRSNSHSVHFRPRRSSDISPNMEYEHFAAPAMSPFEYAVIDPIDEGMPEREDESKVFGHFGYDNEQSALSSTFSPSSRTFQTPFGEHALFQHQPRMTPPRHIASESYSQPNSCSPTRSSPMSPQRLNRRRRRTSNSPSSRTDPIIGQVTLAGKFKCLNEACLDDGDDLTFNRHADFKRHHENIHARRSIEYFCPESGCVRSRNPVGGKKGRGFRGRKDKMNEHHKAVHHKEGKKRKKMEEANHCVEDQSCDDGAGSRKVKATRTSGTS